jgi:type II secretion system protein G
MNFSIKQRWFFALIPFALLVISGMSLRMASRERPQKSLGRYAIAKLANGFVMFEIDCGRFPTTEEGLSALKKCPTPALKGRWRGPYPDDSKIPKDPWGRDYVYRYPGLHNTNGVDVYSLGPNGNGGEEAIGNWNPAPSMPIPAASEALPQPPR